MPARVVVAVRPASPGALPPPDTGPAVNAAVLAAVREELSPEASAWLHDGSPGGPPARPFAITPLLDEHQRAPNRSSVTVRFEVGILFDDIIGSMFGALRNRDRWRFGSTDYVTETVEFVQVEPYPDLLAAATAAPATSWAFGLVTPVSFATGRGDGARRQRILPEPERVFGTLAARWLRWAPSVAPLPADVEAAIGDHLELVDMRLFTTEYVIKIGTPKRRGCVGFVRYQLAAPADVPPRTRGAIDALARFACYAGVGDRTPSGMGYVIADPDGDGTASGARPARRPARPA
ncbi:CRISPR system precrRNA processing endoribonuclease RAMP protein Cas6 [Protofrankia coriariae]|uniref:CRISPR system precrRNA processing endoribonuclease RAMP protein Cas6 n=1 Tax=Protofrankia coriariae TaxID=1562887 RepID=UPI000AF27A8E|nr:CRISPR system precrRNA processing endoribonuclease RAMP protein Cas6 [Protofrankia coriariae]